MGNELEYYISKSSKYKLACGILRNRLSQMMDILNDESLSNDEKVNILSGEMKIVANDETISYDTLDLYGDDYSLYIDHSNEYYEYREAQEKGNQR